MENRKKLKDRVGKKGGGDNYHAVPKRGCLFSELA